MHKRVGLHDASAYVRFLALSRLTPAWEASAQLATMSSDQSSSLTSACITLYNELRKTNKLDLAMEQRAIDRIAKEIASDLTKQ